MALTVLLLAGAAGSAAALYHDDGSSGDGADEAEGDAEGDTALDLGAQFDDLVTNVETDLDMNLNLAGSVEDDGDDQALGNEVEDVLVRVGLHWDLNSDGEVGVNLDLDR